MRDLWPHASSQPRTGRQAGTQFGSNGGDWLKKGVPKFWVMAGRPRSWSHAEGRLSRKSGYRTAMSSFIPTLPNPTISKWQVCYMMLWCTKKSIVKTGKHVWKNPTYVKMSTHQLPGGRKVKTKAGTHIIDRAWRFIKERLKRNQNAKASCSLLSAQIRSAQYE